MNEELFEHRLTQVEEKVDKVDGKVDRISQSLVRIEAKVGSNGRSPGPVMTTGIVAAFVGAAEAIRAFFSAPK